MAVAADVTDLVLANLEVEKASGTLTLALDAADLGIWRTDWGTDNLMFSDRARAMHGISLDESLSFSQTLPVIKTPYRERFLNAVSEAVAEKGTFSETYEINPVDGTKAKWIHSTGKVELDSRGDVVSVIGTLRDITEEKEDEQRKSDFISMVSHEMKTPLTSISAFTQLLQVHAKRQADDYAFDKLERVYGQAKKMSALINGFLDISRLRASGKIHLNVSRYDFNALVQEILHDIQDVYASHTLLFVPEGALELSGDRDKIGSVISNLVSNAIKYSPGKTEVRVSARLMEDSVVFACADDGMGIKAEEISRLFDRFYRADSRQVEHIGGFGIGLYICSEIVKKHSGEIWAESILGTGSTFYVRLPCGTHQ